MESLLLPDLFAIRLLGMSVVELFAATLGLVSVWLTVKQNVLCWPIGAVMVAIYSLLFFRERLHADAGLQVFYFFMQFYGWWQWLHGGARQDALAVRTLSNRMRLSLLLLGSVGTAALGYTLGRFTNQDLSYWDSGVTVFSFVAQWMMARKYLENWLFWIAIDVVATGIYLVKALYPTAVLYAIFTGMAFAGYREWRKSLWPHAH